MYKLIKEKDEQSLFSSPCRSRLFQSTKLCNLKERERKLSSPWSSAGQNARRSQCDHCRDRISSKRQKKRDEERSRRFTANPGSRWPICWVSPTKPAAPAGTTGLHRIIDGDYYFAKNPPHVHRLEITSETTSVASVNRCSRRTSTTGCPSPSVCYHIIPIASRNCSHLRCLADALTKRFCTGW